MSLYPSWQPGYHVSCCSIWSDFGSGSDCLSHPSQISVDPNVWVLKSTTCFLMRCQGDTLQEQRTRGRERRPRCRGERLLLHWCFFFSSKADAAREKTLGIGFTANTSMSFPPISILFQAEKKETVSLRESILFNWTLWRRVNDSHKLYCVWNHLIAMCSSALR